MNVTSVTVNGVLIGEPPAEQTAETGGVAPVGAEAVPLDLDLASLAVRLMDVTKRDIQDVGEEEGLSVPQLDVIRRLQARGPVPMRRLAEQMNCEASNLTGLVDRLEARGLVERLPDPADRRVRVLALTDTGSRLAYQTWATVAKRCPLNALPPEKRAALDDLLREALRGARPSGTG
jgi:DNA-binding MarR family transcriptional regulator